jgi:hypothetical protein
MTCMLSDRKLHEARSATQKGRLAAVGFAVACFVLCLFVQASTGAWQRAFVSYPDEPGHFVSSVMVRDYLASGAVSSPKAFAWNYYQHYPYFAIGIWPPFFHVVSAVWFLLAGVGRVQALVVVAAAASGAATVIGLLVRRRAGAIAGLCAGAVFLSLPQVQYWTCAVMTDTTIAFLSLAAAACLIRYFERQDLSSAIWYILCGACAILTKYSGSFVVVLPFAAALCLRRFDLLRRLSFLMQPIAIGLIVAPWFVWSAKYVSIYPGHRIESYTERVLWFSWETFNLFTPVLSCLVAAGLIVLLLRPRIWSTDIVVTALVYLGLVGVVVVSPPAGLESRYILGASGALLVLAFAGWTAILEALAVRGGLWARAVPAFSLILALSFGLAHLGHFKSPPDPPIRTVVETVASHPEWAREPIIVAPKFEGAMIAEFALHDHHRPSYQFERPTKLFTTMDWFGSGVSRFHSSGEMMGYLRRQPVGLIIWQELPKNVLREHERLVVSDFTEEFLGDDQPPATHYRLA